MDDIKEPATLIPEVGHFILFALDQHPRIGRVTAVNMDAMKPVTIHLWKPNKRCPSLEQAHFKPSDNESGPDLMAIHGSQIKIVGLELKDSGHLTGPSKRKVRKILQPVKSSHPVSSATKRVTQSRRPKKTKVNSTRNYHNKPSGRGKKVLPYRSSKRTTVRSSRDSQPNSSTRADRVKFKYPYYTGTQSV